eukprot:m.51642 g.51642  ORF g.51642 m.51642 type:complete len:457 (+) comp10745_c0_seq2:619-1989(+)
MGAALGTLGLGSCASEAACCCGTAAISRCCCRGCGTSRSSTVTRLAYAFLVFLLTISAWLMLNPKIDGELQKMSKYTGDIMGCENLNANQTRDCEARWGQLGVNRILFSGTVFFGFLACVMIGVKSSNDKRRGIQNGFWGIKFLLIVGIAVAAFFINNSFFLKIWGWIALFGGFAFLIIQLILLVDFAYAWADSWIGKLEDGSTTHKWLIILSSLGMYGLSITATILLFVFYTKSSDGDNCGLNKFFISMNLILGVVCTVVALSGPVQEANPKSGLMQSGVVVSYITYLTWSAISETNSSCQPGNMSVNDDTTTVIGALFTFLAVLYATLRTSSASQIGALGMGSGEQGEASSVLLDDDDALEGGDEGRSKAAKDDELDGTVYNWSFFHFTFAIACLYLTMVLTDWSTIRDGELADFHVGRGLASTWIKVVSSWVSAALYLWTLVAPIALPDRDFN